jgi:hypothetical protein
VALWDGLTGRLLTEDAEIKRVASGILQLLGIRAQDGLTLGYNAAGSASSLEVVNEDTGETIIEVPDPADGGSAYWWVDSQDTGEAWKLRYGSVQDPVVAYDGSDLDIASREVLRLQFNEGNVGGNLAILEGFTDELIVGYNPLTDVLELGFNAAGLGGAWRVYNRNGVDALLWEMDELGNAHLAGQLEQTGASYNNAASPVTAVRETVYYNLDTTAGDVELDLYSCDATTEGALVSVKIVSGANDAILDPSGTELIEGGATSYSFSGSLDSRAFRCNGVGTNPGWWLIAGKPTDQSNQFPAGIQLDSDNTNNGDGRVRLTNDPVVGILQMVPDTVGEIYFNAFLFESGDGSGGQQQLGRISNEGMTGAGLGGKASFNQLSLRKSNYNSGSSPYTLDQFYAVAYVDTTGGDVEFDLPSCFGKTEGFEFHFKITDGTNDVILDPNGVQEIEGSSISLSFSGALEARTIRCEGNGAGEGWWVF